MPAIMTHLEEFRRMGFRSVELEGIREEHLKAEYAQRKAVQDCLAGAHDKEKQVFLHWNENG